MSMHAAKAGLAGAGVPSPGQWRGHRESNIHVGWDGWGMLSAITAQPCPVLISNRIFTRRLGPLDSSRQPDRTMTERPRAGHSHEDFGRDLRAYPAAVE